MITIIDYGVGNLGSIRNMLKKIGADAVISSAVQDILDAKKLILPGVGHFDNCMQMFNVSGVRDAVIGKAMEEKTQILGICVGCQMLLESSQEGQEQGLGWIKGKVVKFDQGRMPAGYPIPHMGWTEVRTTKPSLLTANMFDDPRFYFVHSYHPQADDRQDILLEADYGYTFTAAVQRENITGVQFHPEKSHKFGMRLLENFVNHN